MKHPSLVVFLLSGAFSTALQAGILFGPVKGKQGEIVRMVSHSETPGGTIRIQSKGVDATGVMRMTRDRDLTWSFHDPGLDGTRRGIARISKITTSTVIRINGRDEKSVDKSLLSGTTLKVSKPPGADWNFELFGEGTLPLSRVRNELEELRVYLKRDWFPAREVNVGESWNFNPAWVHQVIERDLTQTKTTGTMTLRQIHDGIFGKTAVIDVRIQSAGKKARHDGGESNANIDLSGQLKVNLKTMLDEQLELSGNVISTTKGKGEARTVNLPIRLKVTKSFVKERG